MTSAPNKDAMTAAIVVTTINSPTPALRELAAGAPRLGARLIVVGDEKSPADFDLPGAHYLDIAAQRASGFELARIAPTRHYARKNVGYLAAIRAGASILVETDDDNYPMPQFWEPRRLEQTGGLVAHDGWVNVYGYFTDSSVWPRGLPLDVVKVAPPPERANIAAGPCPIQQGLADGDPDVDAIFRLTRALPLTFERRPPVVLKGAWCPFNSQNTTWWPQAFPLLYLPSYCSFRMTDIWRSFVALRIAAANGWSLSFHAATVYQDRNAHDLMRDFADEIPGYLHNRAIREQLNGLKLVEGVEHLTDNLVLCYGELIKMGLVAPEEEPLLKAWIRDLHG